MPLARSKAPKPVVSVFSVGQSTSIVAAMTRLNCSRTAFVSGP